MTGHTPWREVEHKNRLETGLHIVQGILGRTWVVERKRTIEHQIVYEETVAGVEVELVAGDIIVTISKSRHHRDKSISVIYR